MGDGNNKTHDSCNDDGMRKRLMNRNYYPHYVNGNSYIVVGASLLVLPLPVVIAELFCRFFICFKRRLTTRVVRRIAL